LKKKTQDAFLAQNKKTSKSGNTPDSLETTNKTKLIANYNKSV